MAENLVSFAVGTQAEYNAATKSDNTLYFITDSKKIYKGEVSFGGSEVKTVTSYPATGEIGVIYLNTSDGSCKFWNGTSYNTIVPEISQTLSATSTVEQLATAKTIYDFVKSEIAKVDAGGINDTITGLEDRIKAVEDEMPNKADSATTLAGYGIVDAYTKTEANSAIATAVANASHLKRTIVTTLPDAADADENTIYLIAKADGKDNQKYDEYLLVNNALEKIGDTTADLTDYAKTADVTSAIGTAKTEITAAYEAADTTTLNSAKTYADGLASNYATAAQGAKADTAIQEVKEGTANGTILVDSTPVSVHGLGSAAYADEGDFDISGAASTALDSAKNYTDNALTWHTL